MHGQPFERLDRDVGKRPDDAPRHLDAFVDIEERVLLRLTPIADHQMLEQEPPAADHVEMAERDRVEGSREHGRAGRISRLSIMVDGEVTRFACWVRGLTVGREAVTPSNSTGQGSPPCGLTHEEKGQQHERDGRQVAVERAALFASPGLGSFLLCPGRRTEGRGQ